MLECTLAYTANILAIHTEYARNTNWLSSRIHTKYSLVEYMGSYATAALSILMLLGSFVSKHMEHLNGSC